ncbi:hypothetical protein CEP54_007220 [Fusarium duplospermum]|uniref:Heterokaryon incompatibility domain-containing protein n=1 Tax=Fusarium duplospermum TaxID=1325734 RepID=A0A428Q2W7_9HYPO|nr:hypothetical protein CEP54_007220 [Fusarium duplospermum]
MDTQESHTEPYSLITLEPTKREIRLLRLLPGGRDDPVKADLFRESLDSSPDFSVLSYSWGPESDKVPITVQGMTMMITRNLLQCLVNLRSDITPLVIWIDAICINQSSNEEKNTQVPLMRDIYKTARDEFVWLGESTTGMDLIVSCIQFIASQDEDFHLDKLEHIAHELVVSPEEIASAFAEFHDLAWFHRTWIIQDHAELSRESPAWQKLHELIGSHPVDNLSTLRGIFSGNNVLTNGLPLSVLIESSKKSLATNPRDKIYGLLGLANDDAKSSLTIDYNKSVQEVYEEVTRYLIFAEGKLNILSGLAPDFIPQWDQSNGNSAPPGLPIFKLQRNTRNVASSWIRDFSHVQISYRPTPFLPDWLPRAVGYDASLNSAPIETSNRQPGELGICGMEVDVVRECQRAWYMLPGSMAYQKDWDAILPIFFRASRPTSSSSEAETEVQFNRAVRMSNDPEWNLPYNPKYGASKTMKEAIWRTVIGDEIFQIAQRAPDYCSRLFGGYIDAVLGQTGHYKVPDDADTTLDKELALFSKFQRRMDTVLYRRSAFSTSDGWIGVGPDDMKAGDIIVDNFKN